MPTSCAPPAEADAPRPTPFPDLERIVVRLPTWVGDAVMATPALRALRRAYPDAEITLMGRPKVIELLDGGGYHDAGIPALSGARAAASNTRELRRAGAQLAVLLPHSFRVAWESMRAGVPLRLGYAREWRGPLLTHSLSPHRRGGRIVPVPMVLQYLELVAAAGAVGDDQGPRLAVPDALREAGESSLRRLGLDPGDSVVALNPGASFGPSKLWPAEHMAAAADALAADGHRILILVGPGEEPLGAAIVAAMRTPAVATVDRPLPLAELKVAMERAALVITTDAGPRHIASAVGTPTVVLMGPTDPRYSHSHVERSVVLRRDVPCGPCHLKICPVAGHPCLRDISPETVVAVARRLLPGG